MGHKTFFHFRRIYWRVLSKLRAVNFLYLPLWILKGREISTKETLGIIYVGSELNKNYLITLACGSYCEESYLGKKWFWQISKIRKQRGSECSLLIIEIFQPLCILFGKKNCFPIPLWVIGEVDISDSNLEIFKNKSLKSDLRRIRKHRLDFEVTNDLRQLHHFYHNMYLPYITSAHGSRAFIMNYDYLVHEFKKCDLLLTIKAKEYISGLLIHYSRKGARLWAAGIKDGNLDYVNDGGMGALYYFSYLYLKQKGYKKVNFGASRAFLTDGVLQYKRKWRQKIVDADTLSFLVKPLLSTPGLKGFFLNNPFIYTDKNKFKGAVFVTNDQLSSKEDLEKICKSYYLPGISEIFVYRFQENDGETVVTIPAEFSGTITSCSAESVLKYQ